MAELSHKLKSWSTDNEQAVMGKYLTYRAAEQMQFGSKVFKSAGFWVVTLVSLFLGGFIWLGTVALLVRGEEAWHEVLLLSLLAALVFPCWPLYYLVTRRLYPGSRG